MRMSRSAGAIRRAGRRRVVMRNVERDAAVRVVAERVCWYSCA